MMATPIYISTKSLERFPFSTSSSGFIFFRCFDNGPSDLYEVLAHCGFDWISLIINNIDHFHVPVGHLYTMYSMMTTITKTGLHGYKLLLLLLLLSHFSRVRLCATP